MNSPYPHSVNTSSGWPAKCGGWGTTADISLLESLNVIAPPVPGLLPVNSSIRRTSAGVCIVSVKDSHLLSSTLPLNALGRPKPGAFRAMFSQSVHAPSHLSRTSSGG